MRAVVQRVTEAHVAVDGETVGAIDRGFLVLLGVSREDTPEQAVWVADKLAGLRVFPDESGKMKQGLREVDGALLVVSQFTLYGDVRRGLRPDFQRAAPGETAERLYQRVVERCREHGLRVETGRFGAHMTVTLANWGPVTIWIDSDEVMADGKRRISNGKGHA